MTGSSPAWFCQLPRCSSRWCSRGQATAAAVPYRAVSVTAVTAGSGQVAGSAKASLCPCRGRRPPVEAGRAGSGGAGKYITRSLRSRPVTSAGRSASSQASRVRS